MRFHHACMRTHDQTIALHTHLWRRAMRYSEAGRGKESKGGRDLLAWQDQQPKAEVAHCDGIQLVLTLLLLVVLYCALAAVALEVFNAGRAGVDAGAGMRDEGRGMDKRACLLEERWHCISFHFFLSHHHHRCIAFPEHSRLLPLAAVAVARDGCWPNS